jgi:hypothetical protein
MGGNAVNDRLRQRRRPVSRPGFGSRDLLWGRSSLSVL